MRFTFITEHKALFGILMILMHHPTKVKGSGQICWSFMQAPDSVSIRYMSDMAQVNRSQPLVTPDTFGFDSPSLLRIVITAPDTLHRWVCATHRVGLVHRL